MATYSLGWVKCCLEQEPGHTGVFWGDDGCIPLDDFDFDRVGGYGETDIERIMGTGGMIRSRRKTEAVIHNAQCFQKIRAEFGSFSEYIWSFTKGKTYLYMGH